MSLLIRMNIKNKNKDCLAAHEDLNASDLHVNHNGPISHFTYIIYTNRNIIHMYILHFKVIKQISMYTLRRL